MLSPLISDIDSNTQYSFVSSVDEARINMAISSTENTENLQIYVKRIFQWASESNRLFRGKTLTPRKKSSQIPSTRGKHDCSYHERDAPRIYE